MKTTYIVFTLISLFILSNACEAQEVENLMTKNDKREMLRLVNQARKKGVRCGKTWKKPVDPLKWDDKLEKAAALKSIDMFQQKYFDHTSPDGETLSDRIDKLQYSWRTIGENLASGPTDVSKAMESWLKSEGHCKNLMKKEFTHMGAAQYGTYWTQVFAKPRGN